MCLHPPPNHLVKSNSGVMMLGGGLWVVSKIGWGYEGRALFVELLSLWEKTIISFPLCVSIKEGGVRT